MAGGRNMASMMMIDEPLNSSDNDEDEGSMWLGKDETDDNLSTTSKVSVTYGWDKARNLPPDAETQATEDDAFYLFVLKSLKILAYIITFLVLIVGTVISKITLLLMTSQLQPSRFIRYCAGKTDNLEANIPELERIAWSWAITFCFMLPEALVLVRAVRICVFKSIRWPTLAEFIFPFIFETCHIIGLTLLVFAVFPSLDAVSGIMLTNAVCLMPALSALGTRLSNIIRQNHLATTATTSKTPNSEWFLASIDLLMILFIVTGLVLWPVFVHQPEGHPWLIPLAGFLTSFGWWENFMIRYIGKKVKDEDDQEENKKEKPTWNPFAWSSHINFNGESRYVTYLVLSIWKCGIFICGMMLSHWIQEEGDVNHLFNQFQNAFASHPLNVTEIRPNIMNNSLPGGSQMYDQFITVFTNHSTPLYTMMAQMLAGWISYMAAKFACKIGIQKFSFSFPLALTVPVSLAIVTSLCAYRSENECFWSSVFPNYLFWTCPKGTILDFIVDNYGWVWVLWILAQIWVSRHVWAPKFQRLERADILFVTPMYNGLLVDQSLVLNRRRDNRTIIFQDSNEDEESENNENNNDTDSKHGNGPNPYQQVSYFDMHQDISADEQYAADCIPKIYACATMWHETREEMMEMLKSIFRMDEDQCARRVARKLFGVTDQDYYEFETHILFDDAFFIDKSEKGWQKRPLRFLLNKYVQDFLATIGKAAVHVHETEDIRLNPPKKYPTPYGGRLEWILPGKTKLILHLKNKDKIRHKKRWSQVMYMYFLLGYRLLNLDISVARKAVIAENTYLLALDGDIDFQPSAVQLLVDLMKKNKNLGAACGRIHPIGSPSLMVWYQKFEYAIGHWFQKATEHVIGCVLCSPGCFSLFRAKALLDDNVMARYTTEPSEAVHFVQYDQGEDRWLCTLLLQRGYRIEYSAASDSKTHCPEDFGDFFNQRRRWAPSTMANIIDLLRDSKRTIKMNENISYPYILYQSALMIGSILGPGTIFLMLIGAFNAAFKINNYTAFLWNFIPVFIFILICFFFKKDIQLIAAQILAAAYALVMVAVVVALMIQIQEDGILAPTSLFFFGVAASFIIAAMLHPLEFDCLPHGIVYYITIPSMYMILIIYSLMNLHDVSWGTREVIEVADESEKKEEPEKKAPENNGFFGFFKPSGTETQGSFELSFAGLFRLMCCTKPAPDETKILQGISDNLSQISKRLDSLENRGPSGSIIGERRSSIGNPRSPFVEPQSHLIPTIEETEEEVPVLLPNEPEAEAEEKQKPEPVNDDIYPIWAEDPALKSATVDFLTGPELSFWHDLIAKYLRPVDKDEKKEDEVKAALLELRNRMVFFFLMINAVFILAIFLLQNNKDTIFIEWPLGAKWNMTYVEDQTEIKIQKDSLSLEPIGVVFVFVFAVVIFIQFTAMLVHRIGTFSHIMASTVIELCSKGPADAGSEEEVNAALNKQGLQMIRRMQKLKTLGGVNATQPEGKRISRTDVARRKTIQNLEKSHLGGGGRKRIGTLEEVVKANFKAARSSVEGQGPRQSRFVTDNKSRVTFQDLNRRRTIVQNTRRRNSRGSFGNEPNGGPGGFMGNKPEIQVQPPTPRHRGSEFH